MAIPRVGWDKNSSATQSHLSIEVSSAVEVSSGVIVGTYESSADTMASSLEAKVGLRALAHIYVATQSLANPRGAIRIQTGGEGRNRVQDRQTAIRLIRKWRTADDPVEQRETLDYLQAALDRDRFSSRRLFP